jgi:signal transduction histidine kinase
MAANRRDDAAPESGRRAPMRIRTHLVILVVGALLPVLAFSAVMTVVSWLQQRATFEQQFLERVRGMTIALDRELEGFIRALQGLATAPELEANDLAAFYRRARRMLATQPAWSTLVVAAASGTQVLNLLRPLGETLPPLEDDDTFRRVRETRQPAVSALIRAPITGQYVTCVGVPVIQNGVVAYVLFAGIDQPVWLQFLKSSPIAPGATMTLLDQNRIVLARTLNAEQWIGHRPSPGLYEKAGASPEAAYRSAGLEGQWFYTAHSRSRVSGWTLATGVPVEGVEAALRGSTTAMALGAAAAVLAALSLALVFGRGIAGPVTSLAGAAKALATGQPVVRARSSAVAEVEEVALAFDEAGALLRDREAAVSEALERERQARLEVERALDERARLLEDAEAANRVKDQFLAMLGHELRNPLSAIGAALAVLDRADPAGELAGRARAPSSLDRSRSCRGSWTTCSTWRASARARSCSVARPWTSARS